MTAPRQSEPAGVRKVVFLSAASDVIPAYAAIQILAPTTLASGFVCWNAQKWDGGDTADIIYFNGNSDVAVGAYGQAFQPNTAQWVLYDTADTPAFQEDWGPVSGSYEIGLAGSGFIIMGGATDGRVLAVKDLSQSIHEGYLCGDLSAAASTLSSPTTATAIQLYKGSSGNLEHGPTVTITNRDTTLTLEADTYIQWTRINGENRIVWAACLADVSSSCP